VIKTRTKVLGAEPHLVAKVVNPKDGSVVFDGDVQSPGAQDTGTVPALRADR
jgi:hypothetical protein